MTPQLARGQTYGLEPAVLLKITADTAIKLQASPVD